MGHRSCTTKTVTGVALQFLSALAIVLPALPSLSSRDHMQGHPSFLAG